MFNFVLFKATAKGARSWLPSKSPVRAPLVERGLNVVHMEARFHHSFKFFVDPEDIGRVLMWHHGKSKHINISYNVNASSYPTVYAMPYSTVPFEGDPWGACGGGLRPP